MLRLSLVYGEPPSSLAERLTAADLSLYMALVEVDGPWWGEGQAAYLRQLASVTAAAAGASVPADDLRIEWTVGRPEAPAAELLDPEAGLRVFAARHGLEVTTA